MTTHQHSTFGQYRLMIENIFPFLKSHEIPAITALLKTVKEREKTNFNDISDDIIVIIVAAIVDHSEKHKFTV